MTDMRFRDELNSMMWRSSNCNLVRDTDAGLMPISFVGKSCSTTIVRMFGLDLNLTPNYRAALTRANSSGD